MKNSQSSEIPSPQRRAPHLIVHRSGSVSEIAERFQKQEGTVLVVALVLLVLLTIIGLSASTTTQIEIMIAGNERVYKQNFYRAEASAMQATQILENTDLKANYASLAWLLTHADTKSLRTDNGLPVNALEYDENFWDDIDTNPSYVAYSLGQADFGTGPDANTAFFALNNGITAGSSLDMGKSSVWDFEVYGRSTMRRGDNVVALGYRKAY
jgi:hypothetical protein